MGGGDERPPVDAKALRERLIRLGLIKPRDSDVPRDTQEHEGAVLRLDDAALCSTRARPTKRRTKAR
jgi:hypothetical protein